MSEPLSLAAYRLATGALRPVADVILTRRLRAGKEDPARIGERRGVASLPRPSLPGPSLPGSSLPGGRLVWLHGASVGESLSVLPLLDRLSAEAPEDRFLVTTGTVTSARLMAERLPPGAVHQYAPIDQPSYVARFLDHWRPDAALFVESELWPGLISQTRARGTPMALVNGRMSPRAYEGWRRRPAAARALLDAFGVILAQDEANGERLSALSGREAILAGNLKHAAAPLPADASALHRLSEAVGGRPCWLAASTHAGEEQAVLDAHRQVARDVPGVLTILAPRHPPRGDEVARLIEGAGLRSARRSAGDLPGPDDEVYLADTLGELGLLYRLADIAFVGGSLSGTGGHNPLEPARLACAIVTGPDLFNFAQVYAGMRAAGGCALVRNGRDLSASLLRLLRDAQTREEMANRANAWAEEAARAVLDDVTDALAPVLAPAKAA